MAKIALSFFGSLAVVLEIKRAFFVDSFLAKNFINSENFGEKCVKIVEFFSQILPQNEISLCQNGHKFFKITKTGDKNFPKIKKIEIEKSEFNAQIQAPFGNIIERERFCFGLDKKSCVIDIFENFAILEIEFLNKSEADTFILPPFLENLAPKEIKNPEIYDTKTLALFGSPIKIDYEKCKKRLEILGDIKLNLNAQIQTQNALGLLLFWLYHRISKHHIRYLKHRERADLDLLYSDFKMASFWLNFWGEIKISPEIFERLSEQMALLISQIRAFEIASECGFRLKDEKTAIKNLQIAADEFTLNLSSENFTQTMKLCQNALNNATKTDGQTIFKSDLALNFRKFILEILPQIKVASVQKSAHEKYINLLYLFENFGDLFFMDSSKFNKKLKKLTKISAKILEIDEILNINFNQTTPEFSQNLAQKLAKNRQKFAQKAPKIAAKLHEISKILKVYYV